MTRVNVIDPAILADQHLFAEFREIPRCISYALQNANKTVDIPNKYTLNAGHVKFFFDKVRYIRDRVIALEKELKVRGYNHNFDMKKFLEQCDSVPSHLQNNYLPDAAAKAINIERILQRINDKEDPSWYRFHRKPIDTSFLALYTNELHTAIIMEQQ
jgi:deoxyribonuclease (pyrimidine dimer)